MKQVNDRPKSNRFQNNNKKKFVFEFKKWQRYFCFDVTELIGAESDAII